MGDGLINKQEILGVSERGRGGKGETEIFGASPWVFPSWCSGSTWGRGGWFHLGRGWLGGGLNVEEDWEFSGCLKTKPGRGDSDKAEARGEGMGD